jgi:3-hydroxybutyrate dehydrogenase
MGSIYSSRAVEDRIDYVTTKTAILGITRAVAIETARSGITCNTICPGTLPTPAILNKIATMASDSGCPVDDVTRDYLGERQPTRRFIEMDAVAAMVVFLCSPAANDITGASLPIDGGWSVA